MFVVTPPMLRYTEGGRKREGRGEKDSVREREGNREGAGDGWGRKEGEGEREGRKIITVLFHSGVDSRVFLLARNADRSQ